MPEPVTVVPRVRFPEGPVWCPDGTLVYSFGEGVKATFPFYVVRLFGGLLYLSGMLLMAWNVVMTARSGRPVSPAIGPVHAGSSPVVPAA